MSQVFQVGLGTALTIPALLFLIVHVLGDFHLQPERLAESKRAGYMSGFVTHCLIVLLLHAVVVLLKPALLPAALILVLSHVVLDYLKYLFTLKLVPKLRLGTAEFWSGLGYVIDQVFHLTLILIVAQGSLGGQSTAVWILGSQELRLILLILLATKPANVSFKQLFSRFSDDGRDVDIRPIAGAGALIGTLERLITVVFLLVNQYASIALIFTAKSIARFERISKNQRFAEYYLIGSLFSILWVVVSYLLLFG